MDPERGKPESPSLNRPDNEIMPPFLPGSIADVDRAITFLQKSLSLFPRSHPRYISSLDALAFARLSRFKVSQVKEDLDKCILHLTETILLSSSSGNRPLDRPDVIRHLIYLALALLERSDKFEQSESVKVSIKYLRYLQRFPLDSIDVPRKLVTESLIRALGTHVRWGAGDGTRDIKEMIVLCNELLVSTGNQISQFPTAAFITLREAANAQFPYEISIELLDKVIECLQNAVKVCPPGLHYVLVALAEQLRIRFFETHSLDDYKEATALLEKILDPNQLGGCPDSIRRIASPLVAQLAFLRPTPFKSPEFSEMAISCLRATLSSPSTDEELRYQFTGMLSTLVRDRVIFYGLSESLEEASPSMSQLVGPLSSQSLPISGSLINQVDVRIAYSTAATAAQQKIQNLEELLSNTPPGTKLHRLCLSSLADWYESKFHHTKDTLDIKESIKYNRLSLEATRAVVDNHFPSFPAQYSRPFIQGNRRDQLP